MGEEAVLSREELDALLEEMPRVWSDRGREGIGARARLADLDLQRANEAFAGEQARMLSNRHQRVISIALIGHREIDTAELAELMLPTDLAAEFQILPRGYEGFLLLSRPLFFQLLSMNFGSGPTIKPTRPPTRDYSRIERRFYDRAAREMIDQLSAAWKRVNKVDVMYGGLASRASVAESQAGDALLATFDVKGFGEACRIRVAIPIEAFARREGGPAQKGGAVAAAVEVSVLDVPIRLRAQIGTAELSLAAVGRLKVGDVIPLDVPSDGSLVVKIGDQEKFRGIAGTRGARRAVQLGDRLGASE